MTELGARSDPSIRFGALDRAWEEALAPWRGTSRPFSLLFSGGVDSSLIAWELRGSPGLELVTVGTRGSRDLASAESAARILGLRWSGSIVETEQIRSARERTHPMTEGSGRVSRSVLVALALAVDRAGTPEVLCGQGADELFLGYAHFRGIPSPEVERRARADWERLLSDDWPRSQAIARSAGRTLFAPYLHPGFSTAALAFPIEERLPEVTAKPLFRAWAGHRELPTELVDRPKKALQYGSGIDRALRALDGPISRGRHGCRLRRPAPGRARGCP